MARRNTLFIIFLRKFLFIKNGNQHNCNHSVMTTAQWKVGRSFHRVKLLKCDIHLIDVRFCLLPSLSHCSHDRKIWLVFLGGEFECKTDYFQTEQQTKTNKQAETWWIGVVRVPRWREWVVHCDSTATWVCTTMTVSDCPPVTVVFTGGTTKLPFSGKRLLVKSMQFKIKP